jgi:hypothetical protein
MGLCSELLSKWPVYEAKPQTIIQPVAKWNIADKLRCEIEDRKIILK